MQFAVTSSKPEVVGVNSTVVGGINDDIASAGAGDVRFLMDQLPALHPVTEQEHFMPASQYEHESSEGWIVERRLALLHSCDSHA